MERLRGARVPVFFCHATADGLVPFGQGQVLYESYTGPKDHWWVEGASHYNIRQRRHDEYRARLRDFLEQCLAGPEDAPRSPVGHLSALQLRGQVRLDA